MWKPLFTNIRRVLRLANSIKRTKITSTKTAATQDAFIFDARQFWRMSKKHLALFSMTLATQEASILIHGSGTYLQTCLTRVRCVAAPSTGRWPSPVRAAAGDRRHRTSRRSTTPRSRRWARAWGTLPAAASSPRGTDTLRGDRTVSHVNVIFHKPNLTIYSSTGCVYTTYHHCKLLHSWTLNSHRWRSWPHPHTLPLPRMGNLHSRLKMSITCSNIVQHSPSRCHTMQQDF